MNDKFKAVAITVGVFALAAQPWIFPMAPTAAAAQQVDSQKPSKAETDAWLAEVRAKYPTTEGERASAWLASKDQDDMSSKTIYHAEVHSSNTLNFAPPYYGEQRATLTVRKHPRWGQNVYISIEKGQLLCGYPSCSVIVRFDDGPAQTFSANGPEDHSSTVLFINNEARFVERLKKSKTVAIQMNVYRHGAPIVKFDTQNFPSSHFAAGSKK